MSNAFFKQSSVQELKQRLLFLLGAIIVYRIGATIPVPRVKSRAAGCFV